MMKNKYMQGFISADKNGERKEKKHEKDFMLHRSDYRNTERKGLQIIGAVIEATDL